MWIDIIILACVVVVVVCNWLALRENKKLKQENVELKTIVANKNVLIQALQEENVFLKELPMSEEEIMVDVVEEIKEEHINPFEAVTIYESK
jgi:uncharacterized membrane protein YcjF (UPF0283 family)